MFDDIKFANFYYFRLRRRRRRQRRNAYLNALILIIGSVFAYASGAAIFRCVYSLAASSCPRVRILARACPGHALAELLVIALSDYSRGAGQLQFPDFGRRDAFLFFPPRFSRSRVHACAITRSRADDNRFNLTSRFNLVNDDDLEASLKIIKPINVRETRYLERSETYA